MEHVNIPDSQLHEPKGAANALSGSFYRSNGTGSGSWGKLTTTNVEGMSASQDANRLVVTNGSGGFSTKPLPLESSEVSVAPEGGTLQAHLDAMALRIDDLEARVAALEGAV